MRKVIFLDRDGVINKERGAYTFKVVDFEINEGVVEFLKLAQEKGYEFIVITNQGGISKGIYNKNDVYLVHAHMVTQLKKAALTVLEIYYCPHHSDVEECICRKPDSLLLEKAIARFNIDKAVSFMIGDSQRDIDAATKAGVRSFKVEPNTSLNQLKNYLF